MTKKHTTQQLFPVIDSETKDLSIEVVAKAMSLTAEEEEAERFKIMEAGVSAGFARVFGVKKGKA